MTTIRIDLERALADLATTQHGVVSAAQLRALGLSTSTINRWAACGRLHRLHRGVYAVGHMAVRATAHDVAAVLVLGEGAALSHTSAAAWWGIRPRSEGSVHVAVPGGGTRARRRGITLHRLRYLTSAEVTVHDGLPVTTVARTLLDLAGSRPRYVTDRAVEVALRRGLLTDDIHAVLANHPSARGRRTLIDLIAFHGDDPQWRQSDFEAYVLDLCRQHDIAPPQTNVPVLGVVVDAYWPEHRLVVEPDGMTWHGTLAAARRDRANDAKRYANGILTIRVTDEMARQDGRGVAAAIQGAMRR